MRHTALLATALIVPATLMLPVTTADASSPRADDDRGAGVDSAELRLDLPNHFPPGCNRKSARGNSHLVVCFQPYGDKVWVYDGAKDGRRAVAVWKGVDFRRSGKCYNAHGKGHWAYCNYNFPEEHAIGLSGYTQNGANGKQQNILYPASYSGT